ncbi:MAG: ammonia-forming cytochrome c nitrite reductase [Zoogloeaceae bacterium]|jgi:nitrite reductase (cytochrome c-552)|nr:ammonia-forming cytochrome c nitrite reductase [Zoogloeaceae bacterium]
MSKLAETIKRSPSVGWLLLIAVMVIVFLLGLLASSITERRAEVATLYNNKKVEISGIESRNDQWGLNYPREFDSWKQTREKDFKSKYLGNVPEDVLESRPNMVVLWAGYAFSRDYSAPRGHWYTLYDMRKSLRTGSPGVNDMGDMQPGTCWTCKSPDVPRLMKEKGIENYYKAKWSDWGAEIVNPLGCADCHDPKTMNLTITRPALVEAFQRQGKDIAQSSPQDMRSLVCAQCHVEYYFKGDGKYLTFPWDKGLTLEDMEKYYDEINLTDWTHALSKAPMLKAQHPDYELWMLGTHGKRNVSCADCHMPYKSEGGIKYSDHHVMSPLKNIAATCQTCHRDSEENLRSYVYDHQDKVMEIRNRVEPELAKAHIMAKAALDAGVTADEIKPAQKLLRQAGWRWDYGVASHGAAFHAPVETARILAGALDKSLLAQIELQKLLNAKGITEVNMPDISTKAKAQAYIGLNMDKLNADNKRFIDTIIPKWIEEARQKGNLTQPDLIEASLKTGE